MKPHIDLPQLTCSYKSFRSILLKPIHQVLQEAACKFIFMIRQFSRYRLIYRVLIARSFAGSVFIIYRSFNLYIWEAQIKCPQNHHVFLINGPDYLLIHIVHLNYHYQLSNFQRIELFKLLILNQFAICMLNEDEKFHCLAATSEFLFSQKIFILFMKSTKFPAKMHVPSLLRYTILTVLGQLPPRTIAPQPQN